MPSEGPHPLLGPAGQLLLLGAQVCRVQRGMGEEAGAITTTGRVKPAFGERRCKWMNECGGEAGIAEVRLGRGSLPWGLGERPLPRFPHQ